MTCAVLSAGVMSEHILDVEIYRNGMCNYFLQGRADQQVDKKLIEDRGVAEIQVKIRGHTDEWDFAYSKHNRT